MAWNNDQRVRAPTGHGDGKERSEQGKEFYEIFWREIQNWKGEVMEGWRVAVVNWRGGRVREAAWSEAPASFVLPIE